VALLLLAAGAAVGGCGERAANAPAGGGAGEGTPPAGASATAGGGGPAAGAPGKRLVIAVIPKGTTHVFWKSVHAGAEKAGGEMNAEIRWQGPEKESDAARQLEIVENAITGRMDGIVLAPLDKAALVPAIKKAKTADIPLTIFDSAADTDEYVSFVATDNKKGGQLAAERMGQLLGGKGKVAVIPVQPNSASTGDREVGFEETIKSKYPGITVIRSNYGNSDRAQSLKVTEDVLTAHDDIAGIFGPNESSTVGALQALKNRNLVGKIRLVGFDATKQLEDSLRKGEIDSLVLQNPFKMGYEGVKTIVDRKAGKTPERRIDTGVALMTKDNLDSAEMKALRSAE
jgi:ribose transport system substrate-binding protein